MIVLGDVLCGEGKLLHIHFFFQSILPIFSVLLVDYWIILPFGHMSMVITHRHIEQMAVGHGWILLHSGVGNNYNHYTMQCSIIYKHLCYACARSITVIMFRFNERGIWQNIQSSIKRHFLLNLAFFRFKGVM